MKIGVLLNYPRGEPDELWINSGEGWTEVPLVGGTFPDAFMGIMSNLQRFATGEDESLRTSVDDAGHTMALAEACFCSNESSSFSQCQSGILGAPNEEHCRIAT